MKFEVIASKIGHIPAIPNDKGKIIYDFILREKPKDILEIGFFHGKSAIYMAAALDEIGAGKIVAVDIVGAERIQPNIEQLSAATCLAKFIEPIYSERGSQWEMHRLIENNTVAGVCKPIFDFCFIDGFHSWEMAGLDFFLSEKLLRSGGWVLFDDLDWTFASSASWRNLPETKAMSDDYCNTRQVREVFELLVKQHPRFHNFRIHDGWGWAQKFA